MGSHNSPLTEGGTPQRSVSIMSDTERDTISPVPVNKNKIQGQGDVESSDDESSEIVNNGETDSSSTDNGDHDGTNGVTNRVNGSSTDSEEEVEENDLEKHDDAVHDAVPNGNNGFTVSGEPEFKPKKAADSDSSDTEDNQDSDEDSEGEIAAEIADIDVNDGCISSKVAEDEDNEEDAVVKITETAPSPQPEKSPSPVPVDTHTPERSPSPEDPSHHSPDRSRSPTPERKDSRGSHGSSSYDEERASSLSPEPPKVIAVPTSKLTSPVSPPPSQNKSAITKIYTEALVNDSYVEDVKQMRKSHLEEMKTFLLRISEDKVAENVFENCVVMEYVESEEQELSNITVDKAVKSEEKEEGEDNKIGVKNNPENIVDIETTTEELSTEQIKGARSVQTTSTASTISVTTLVRTDQKETTEGNEKIEHTSAVVDEIPGDKGDELVTKKDDKVVDEKVEESAVIPPEEHTSGGGRQSMATIVSVATLILIIDKLW